MDLKVCQQNCSMENLLLKALERARREKQNTCLVACRDSQSSDYCRLDLAKIHDSHISS